MKRAVHVEAKQPVVVDGFVARAYEQGMRLQLAGGWLSDLEPDLEFIERKHGKRTADVVVDAIVRDVEPRTSKDEA